MVRRMKIRFKSALPLSGKLVQTPGESSGRP
jgi:hypothetical protein